MKQHSLIILTLIAIAFIASCENKVNKKEQSKDTNIEWYEPEDSSPREQCPCCDYISLPERGNYLICPICFWEDDGLDIDELDISSGPNHGITLREGRANFEKFGACEKEMLEHIVSSNERNKYKRKIRKLE